MVDLEPRCLFECLDDFEQIGEEGIIIRGEKNSVNGEFSVVYVQGIVSKVKVLNEIVPS